jgi:hypothetical protein
MTPVHDLLGGMNPEAAPLPYFEARSLKPSTRCVGIGANQTSKEIR